MYFIHKYQIQQKVKENVLKIGLKHFVELSCHELWGLEVSIFMVNFMAI